MPMFIFRCNIIEHLDIRVFVSNNISGVKTFASLIEALHI